MSLSSVVVAVISLLGGGGAGAAIIKAVFNRKTVSATAEQIAANKDGTVVATTRELLKGVTDEMARVRAEQKSMEVEVAALHQAVRQYRGRVDYLTSLIVRAQIPVTDWVPPNVD